MKKTDKEIVEQIVVEIFEVLEKYPEHLSRMAIAIMAVASDKQIIKKSLKKNEN